ncbi:energy transducer TonB [Erythrobacter sp. LQ02-29]|uniref:TonB family protein n=1 Tax=Erythrobacter sp. LQ02-29 TaxID=2920384 RepID=UPI001F4EF430|nr:TonB family protein [Erythrobacter sp. LQ02-29]MCP9223689.1 energy transducer TonB [Erythrobacter sp. LQ02-29]
MLLPLFAALLGSVPPPPPVAVASDGVDTRGLIDFEAEGYSCEGTAVTPVRKAAILPIAMRPEVSLERDSQVQTVGFAIDAQGRTISIRLPDGTYGDDIAPALAATRFAAGTPRQACTARIVARYYPHDQIPRALAARYWTIPTRDRPRLETHALIAGPDGNCEKEPPRWLVRAQPDFDRVPVDPGALDFVAMTYSVDSAGRPRDIEARFTSGNAAFTQVGKRVMAQWRFQPGEARAGCAYGYWSAPRSPLPPPPLDPGPMKKECPDLHFAYMPELGPYFPRAFSQRSIEGIALLRFSVAPWGQIGDVEVVESQPAEAFGEAAMLLLPRARLDRSDAPRVGCTATIRFSVPKRSRDTKG